MQLLKKRINSCISNIFFREKREIILVLIILIEILIMIIVLINLI